MLRIGEDGEEEGWSRGKAGGQNNNAREKMPIVWV